MPNLISTQLSTSTIPQTDQLTIMDFLQHMHRQQKAYWRYAKIRDDSNRATFQKKKLRSFDSLLEFSDFFFESRNSTHITGLEDSTTPKQDVYNMDEETNSNSDGQQIIEGGSFSFIFLDTFELLIFISCIKKF